MHKSLTRCLLAALFAVLLSTLSGCGALQTLLAPETTSQEHAGDDQILNDNIDFTSYVALMEKIYSAPPEQLLPLYRQANKRYNSQGKIVDGVHLALLLSVPGTSFTDTGSALRLLESAQQSNETRSDDVEQIIRLSLVYLSGRDRLEKQLKTESEIRRTLQQQLTELKSIEEQLDSRQ